MDTGKIDVCRLFLSKANWEMLRVESVIQLFTTMAVFSPMLTVREWRHDLSGLSLPGTPLQAETTGLPQVPEVPEVPEVPGLPAKLQDQLGVSEHGDNVQEWDNILAGTVWQED